MAFGWAVKGIHEAGSPESPHWHDHTPFHSDFLMDDIILILIEPLLGIRPWLSAAAVEHGAKLILRDEAINERKKAEEGFIAIEQLVWGPIRAHSAGRSSSRRLKSPRFVRRPPKRCSTQAAGR